jgi:hypothetical protein
MDVKKLVINPEEMDVLYPSYSVLSAAASSSPSVEYLIVTTDALKDAFLPLKAWKIQKGVTTEIITLSEIYANANYSAPTNQLRIKKCLQDYYVNRGLKWVLLGGDNTVVPVQICTMDGRPRYDIFGEIPTDLFYACFDQTFNWDYNGNGIIGEKSDLLLDLFPEINIARLPIRTTEHVRAFLQKLLAYEKNPPISNHINKLLLAGLLLDSIWDNKSDAHHLSERMYEWSFKLNKWDGEKYWF